MANSSVVAPSAPISNTTAPAAAENLNAFVPQSPSGSAASGLKEKPRNAVSGQSSIDATQQANGMLVAAGLTRRPTLIQRINKFNKVIIPAVESYKPGAVPIRTPVPGAPTVKPGPRIDVPSGAPINNFFGPGSPVVTAPGVPALQGQPSASVLAVINDALPQSTVNAFASLSQKQKLIARTMLGAAIEGLKAGPSSPDYVAPKEFKAFVGLILKNAQAYREPTNIVPSPPATKPSAVPGASTTKPAIVPKLPLDPAIVQTLPNDPKAAIEASKNRTPPTATAPSTTTPSTAPIVPMPSATAPTTAPSTTSARPPEIAGLTLTPEIYGELIKGADGKVDPVRKANTDNLLTQAQEFRAQIDTINVNQAVNPARSTKTPMQEWRDWKLA
jgi:hypothetical protein